MAITAIKRVHNQSSFSISVQGVDLPTSPAHSATIAPGGSADVDMWVPWARSTQEFAEHHLTVSLLPSSPSAFVIWQFADDQGGDFVRMATDGAWHDPGLPIGGLADVGGDRHLVVADDRIALIAAGRHGMTSIIRIDNASSGPLNVLSTDGIKPIQSFDVDIGESLDVDIWIPWAPVAGDLATHNINLTMGVVSRWRVWQADQPDGDFVRATTDLTWRSPGPRIGGNDQVDGDRVLVVLDDTIELMSGARRPKPPPGEGDDTINMPVRSQFHFSSRESLHPDRKLVSVTNDTRDVNDEVTIPLVVSLTTDSGSVGQTRIEPNDSSNAFSGFPFNGQWDAVAVQVSQLFLKEFVTLLVHWTGSKPIYPDMVSCVQHNESGIIVGLGGKTDKLGNPWTLGKQEAITQIKNGRTLYVIGMTGKRTRVVVRQEGTLEYLSTLADKDLSNNLSHLPECPGK